ncbi:MAG: hypothetical protein RL344_868 [Pseudomonadota bacterium]
MYQPASKPCIATNKNLHTWLKVAGYITNQSKIQLLTGTHQTHIIIPITVAVADVAITEIDKPSNT